MRATFKEHAADKEAPTFHNILSVGLTMKHKIMLSKEGKTAYVSIDPESVPQAERVLFAFFSHIHMLVDAFGHLQNTPQLDWDMSSCCHVKGLSIGFLPSR